MQRLLIALLYAVELEYVFQQWRWIAREFGSRHALCVLGCRACLVGFLPATVIDRVMVCGRLGICLVPVVIDRSRIRFYVCPMCVRLSCLYNLLSFCIGH